MGSIVGVGIFNLPTSLAGYGPITLISMALTTVGAIALALLFAARSRRLPADGGPYAYARVAYGNGWGFASAWSYWISAWRATPPSRWAGSSTGGVHQQGQATLGSILLVLVGLWVPALINLSGVRRWGRSRS